MCKFSKLLFGAISDVVAQLPLTSIFGHSYLFTWRGASPSVGCLFLQRIHDHALSKWRFKRQSYEPFGISVYLWDQNRNLGWLQRWPSEKKALQVVALLDPLLQNWYVKAYLLLNDMSERHSAGSIWLAEQSSIVTTSHSLFPRQQGRNLLCLCFSFTIVHS